MKSDLLLYQCTKSVNMGTYILKTNQDFQNSSTTMGCGF